MEEALPAIFAIVLVVLTTVLSVVGIYLLTVLKELKQTLQKINTSLDVAEEKITAITVPLQQLGGMATGMKTGFTVLESFVGWIHKDEN